jgi:hypothetical protein
MGFWEVVVIVYDVDVDVVDSLPCVNHGLFLK